MKKTAKNTTAIACLGTLLFSSPWTFGQAPDDVIREDLLGATNVRVRTMESVTDSPQMVITFEGREGLTYNVQHCSNGVWTSSGTATVSDGTGLLLAEGATDRTDSYDVFLDLHGDSEAPVFRRTNSLTAQILASGSIQLRWAAATDDHRVVAYGIYLKDVMISSYEASQTCAVIEGLPPEAMANLTLVAADEHGNVTHGGAAVVRRKPIDHASPIIAQKPARRSLDVTGDRHVTPLDVLLAAKQRPSGWTDRVYLRNRGSRSNPEGAQAEAVFFPIPQGPNTIRQFQSPGDAAAEYVDKFLPFFDW